jgi:hypothetical protein
MVLPEAWGVEVNTRLIERRTGSLFLRDAITPSARTAGAAWMELAMMD